MLKLVKHQRPNVDKVYLYVKDTFESKCQLLISGAEKNKRNQKTSKALIYYLQAIGDVYENLEYYNSTQKKKC